MSSNIYDKEQNKLIPFAGNSEATAGSLDGLTDVNISSPTDGQVLTYDAENQVWKNGAGATVIESLGDIADVDLTDLEDGQTIIWDAVEQKWIPGESGSDYLAGFGIEIDANNRVKTTDFVGTQAEWNALTTTEKEAYDFVHITDDATDVNYFPGHAISDGTSEKTQREVLEFYGFDVSDDSVNGKTKVAEIPYTAGEGIEIDANKEVTTDPDLLPFTFIGTKAEWEGLTTDEKAQYKLVNLTDDVVGGDMYVEDAVTEDSVNPVTSGAVYNTLKWKLVDSKTGTNTIILPSSFNELHINCTAPVGLNFSFHIIKEELSSSFKAFIQGSCRVASEGTLCYMKVSLSSVQLNSYSYNGGSNDATSTATTTVWYR